MMFEIAGYGQAWSSTPVRKALDDDDDIGARLNAVNIFNLSDAFFQILLDHYQRRIKKLAIAGNKYKAIKSDEDRDRFM